jgi:hypothetical protein
MFYPMKIKVGARVIEADGIRTCDQNNTASLMVEQSLEQEVKHSGKAIVFGFWDGRIAHIHRIHEL